MNKPTFTNLDDIDDECDFPDFQNVEVRKTTVDFYEKHSRQVTDDHCIVFIAISLSVILYSPLFSHHWHC